MLFSKEKVGIVIPTYNPDQEFDLLCSILTKIDCPVLVIDSSTKSFAEETTKKYGFQFVKISQNEFNHGFTREMGRKMLNCDIVVFLTQDIIPTNDTFLEELIRPIIHGDAVIAYSRQVSKNESDAFESFPRIYNYGETSQLRSIKDVDRFGIYTFFCSDSCSAYLNSALDEIGGFPEVLTHEDFFVTVLLLSKGYKIAYVAQSIVKHSHRYNLIEEFKRYFDAGYVRAKNKWVVEITGNAEARGSAQLLAFLSYLLNSNPLMIPYAFSQYIVKYIGYRAGFLFVNFPKPILRRFSTLPHYFK